MKKHTISTFSALKGCDTESRLSSSALRLSSRLGALVLALSSLAGCSAFNIGKSEFSCPGMPDGVQCMSTRDVYAATDDGQVPAPMRPEEGERKGVESKGEMASVSGQPSLDPAQDPVSAYVAPRLPDQPVPIRTPAEVMRIWVAPWEDTNGDLNVSGYVYTEIEPRRWVLGDPAPSSNPVLSPLTVRPAPKKAPAAQIAAPAAQPKAAAAANPSSTENTPSTGE